jgi:hypothetical protein
MLFLTRLVGIAQSLDQKELGLLYSSIGIYLTEQEFPAQQPTSEYIVCFLDVDSSGSINNMHLLADEKNHGFVYNCLQRMPITAFQKYKLEKCTGRTIMLPLLTIGKPNCPDYATRIKAIYPAKRVKVESETKQMVVVSALLYDIPVMDSRTKMPGSK